MIREVQPTKQVRIEEEEDTIVEALKMEIVVEALEEDTEVEVLEVETVVEYPCMVPEVVAR